MLSKNLENSLSYGIFYKFWEKARVYYTLSISREGGGGAQAPPGFATDIQISFSAENNVNLYVQFSNCSRPILAMYNDQQLYMWDRKFCICICSRIDLHE